jgi:hypothetical protein
VGLILIILVDTLSKNLELLPGWSIISGVVIVLGSIAAFIKNIKRIIDFLKLFKFKRQSKLKKLKNHIIFKKIDDTISYNKIKAKTTLRNEIALILKDIKLKTYKEKILQLLDEDIKSMIKDELIKKSKDLLYDYSYESNKKFKKESHNKEEEKTAEIILNKFKTYESEQIKVAISVIDDISVDKNIKNFEIIDNVLTAYQFLINNIIETTVETVNRLNGELAGKVFLGQKIEKHDGKI